MDRLEPIWRKHADHHDDDDRYHGDAGHGGSAAAHKPPGKRPAPFSLRLSEDERALLEEWAGRQSLSSFIKERLFGDTAPPPRAARRSPVADDRVLASLLGKLGASGIARNLSELAEAARVGALPVNEEALALIEAACGDIAGMRHELMRALGMRSTASPDADDGGSESAFRTASAPEEPAP